MFCFRQYFKAAYYYLDEPQRMASGVTRDLPNWEEELGPDGGKGAIPLEDFHEHVVSSISTILTSSETFSVKFRK